MLNRGIVLGVFFGKLLILFNFKDGMGVVLVLVIVECLVFLIVDCFWIVLVFLWICWKIWCVVVCWRRLFCFERFWLWYCLLVCVSMWCVIEIERFISMLY